jgi:hypothetical protein
MAKKTNHKTKKELEYANYRTFKEFVDNVKIPERTWKFFENFINKDLDCYGNAVRSYHDAGYAETTTSKYRAIKMYNSAIVQRLLTLYRQKTAEKRENADISVFDRTHNDLLWALDNAKQAHDYQAVRAISMDIAKLHGILVDKHQVLDAGTDRQISHTKQLAAAQVAERMLIDAPEGKPDNVIDTTFEPLTELEGTEEVYNNAAESALLGHNQVNEEHGPLIDKKPA